MPHTVLVAIAFAALVAGCGSSPAGPGSAGAGPSLVSPGNGASVTGPHVAFEWDAVTGATKYYHQVAPDSSMQGPEETTTTSPALTMSPGSAGTWWWRVRASVTGQSTYTDWSATWSFILN